MTTTDKIHKISDIKLALFGDEQGYEDRLNKAIRIVESGSLIWTHDSDPTINAVDSQFSDESYDVVWSEKTDFTCTCKDFKFEQCTADGKPICKHIIAIQIQHELDGIKRMADVEPAQTKDDGRLRPLITLGLALGLVVAIGLRLACRFSKTIG